ncbi:cysteine desulfurase activator complex subunit SufB [Anopheles sinensis]|uniref:Cysteine desulfurase activator complex subunit SufB n=1 Tax=Anopheles sinensis TaxID=74873 RepID=A0A084W932_ANOSI|nr:cysteine desulfurase activator complex subunit SufB [Anopheles sinensis]
MPNGGRDGTDPLAWRSLSHPDWLHPSFPREKEILFRLSYHSGEVASDCPRSHRIEPDESTFKRRLVPSTWLAGKYSIPAAPADPWTGVGTGADGILQIVSLFRPAESHFN